MPYFRSFFALLIVAVSLAVPAAHAQLNSQEQRLATLLASTAGQKRPSVQVDPILSKVARARAADMARRHYFAHVNPDGKGPNYLVRQAGYPLPAHYDPSPGGNNIESCAAGDTSADSAWNGLMNSPSHKTHLLALNSFYADQTAIGVGYVFDAGSDYQHYYVVLTAPPTGPALAITSPAVNAGLTVAQATVTGTSGGSPAAARIVWRLENSAGTTPFANATGTKAWSAVAAGFAPGANTVRVRSLDAAGTTLKEVTRGFRFVVPTPLAVAVEGQGTVSTGFLGTSQRELGARYSITAKPATGWLFDRWSGGIESTTATVSFVMAEGLALTARFRENPFYALKGSYNGLVQASSAAHSTSGFLKLSTAVSGSFTGRLTLAGKGYALSGKFDEAGNAQVTIKRTGLPSLVLALSLDLAGGTQQITGTVGDGTFTASFSADQALPAKSKHFAAGRYTVALPPNPAETGGAVPGGTGSALVVVSATGVASVSGTLADGRTFTASATVSKNGELPLYVSLLSGAGSLAGRATIAPGGAVGGTMLWTKPERLKDRHLPAGFVTRTTATGARYTPAKAGTSALAVTATENNSTLQLSGGELPSAVRQTSTLLPTNRVTIANPQLPKLALTVTASTGRITGSFTHPLTKAASRITGVILQDRNAAAGFFLCQTASGAVSFSPAP